MQTIKERLTGIENAALAVRAARETYEQAVAEAKEARTLLKLALQALEDVSKPLPLFDNGKEES